MTVVMTPWPRRLVNFPIILIAIIQQYIWAATIAFDPASMSTTGVTILTKLFSQHWMIPIVLTISATMAWMGFEVFGFACKLRRRGTLLCLLPQQFMLYVSAGGAIDAITHGHFADGVERSIGFLLVDQVPLVLIAIFHTWALALIMIYSED